MVFDVIGLRAGAGIKCRARKNYRKNNFKKDYFFILNDVISFMGFLFLFLLIYFYYFVIKFLHAQSLIA